MTKVALYARYSSDNQSVASIEDQFRICREQAAREKWKVIGTYHDAAISGASVILRPGIQSLLGSEYARAKGTGTRATTSSFCLPPLPRTGEQAGADLPLRQTVTDEKRASALELFRRLARIPFGSVFCRGAHTANLLSLFLPRKLLAG